LGNRRKVSKKKGIAARSRTANTDTALEKRNSHARKTINILKGNPAE
jgi:hypothetical protein